MVLVQWERMGRAKSACEPVSHILADASAMFNRISSIQPPPAAEMKAVLK